MFAKTISRKFKHAEILDPTSKWFLLRCAQHTDNASTVPRVGMYYATLLTAAQGSKYTHLTYAIFLRESHFATYLVL